MSTTKKAVAKRAVAKKPSVGITPESYVVPPVAKSAQRTNYLDPGAPTDFHYVADQNPWGFAAETSWLEQDFRTFGKPMIEWNFEMMYANKLPTGGGYNYAVQDDWTRLDQVAYLPLYGCGYMDSDKNFGFVNAKNNLLRLAGHGRQTFDHRYSCAFTLNLRIEGYWYSIPDLWMHTHWNHADIVISGNWKNYANWIPNSTSSGKLEVYGYRNGDLNQPYIINLYATTRGGGRIVTIAEVVDPIYSQAANVGDLFDEFNYKMALVRFNVANDVYRESMATGLNYGWQGWTANFVSKFLTSKNKGAQLVDPAIDMGGQDVTLQCRDLYIIDVKAVDRKTVYAQQYTVQNGTESATAVLLKTPDFAWSVADTHSITNTQQYKYGVKVTLKMSWKTGVNVSPFVAGDWQVEIAVEGSFESTWGQSETWTTTNTRTMTMAGQTIATPSKSAYNVTAVMEKITAVGLMGSISEIEGDTLDAAIYTIPRNASFNSQSKYTAQIDVLAAKRALNLGSVQDGAVVNGVLLEGAFVIGEFSFRSEWGSGGTVRVDPAPYVNPDDADTLPIILGQGKASK